ncbi:hypothetical protein LZC95_22140 [Pendulispora brunnea]|uniref:Uncharacterized protein n=1 Tax=Pendulispora brunnea TaxID=2905690 RepID=A0ABZ2KLT4_9BACT
MGTKIRRVAMSATLPTLAGLALTALFAAACGSGGSTTGNGADDQDDPNINAGPGEVGVCTPLAVVKSGSIEPACTAAPYAGRARVVQATVLDSVSTSLIDTGELPGEGGSLGAKVLSVSVPDLLSADVATANIEGENGTTTADANVTKLNATVLGIGISADVAQASATAKCAGAGVESSGSGLVTNLKVAGLKVDVTNEPNQVFEVRGLLRIVLNEQIKWDDGMRVRAIHITALPTVQGGVDVVLSSADARVDCTSAPPCGGSSGGTGGSGGGSGGSGGGSGAGGGGGSGEPGAGGGNNPGGRPDFPIGGGKTGEACDASHACADGYSCKK